MPRPIQTSVTFAPRLLYPVPAGPGARIETWAALLYQYRHGRCTVFAQALRDVLHYRLEGLFVGKTALHVYGVRPDGVRVDVGGVFQLADAGAGEPDGTRVRTESVDDARLHDLMWVCEATPYRGELRALKQLIRLHPQRYGMPTPRKGGT